MRHIKRVESRKGWRVRYRSSSNGVVIDKIFSDTRYGNEHAALLAALAWRDEMLAKHPYTPFRTRPQNKTTGVPGVTETFRRNSKGEKIPCFYVSWRPYKGVRKVERFYHHHYGSREEALQAAIAFRKQKEQEILRRYLAGEYDKKE